MAQQKPNDSSDPHPYKQANNLTGIALVISAVVVWAIMYHVIDAKTFQVLAVLSGITVIVGMVTAVDLPRDNPNSPRRFLCLVNGLMLLFWALVFIFFGR